jgi:D-3-phosphoglycerate dehydrogenase
MIARGGAGLDNIDEAACALRGVKVVHAGGANSDAVGEQAVGMLLALTHRIASADREVRNGLWRREANRGIELSGRTVGILGYGHTGRAFARRIAAFGTRNLAYDKYLEHYGDGSASQAAMEQLFAEAEILSLHIPLTEETSAVLNACGICLTFPAARLCGHAMWLLPLKAESSKGLQLMCWRWNHLIAPLPKIKPAINNFLPPLKLC